MPCDAAKPLELVPDVEQAALEVDVEPAQLEGCAKKVPESYRKLADRHRPIDNRRSEF